MDKFRVHPKFQTKSRFASLAYGLTWETTKYAEEARDACDEFLAACRNLRT